jgi:hypothetical protein
MAAARSDTDRELTAHQLDAFHKTFNFCMSCRQYTCPNCWNEAEARCLTCAPNLSQEVMPAPFPDMAAPSFLVARTASTNGSNGSHAQTEAVNGFELAEAEAAAGAETEIGSEADDDIDFAARLDSLTGAPAVVVPPFPSEVWEAEPSEPAPPEAVAAEVAPEPVAEANPIAAAAEPVAEAEPTATAAETEAKGTTVADLAAAAIVADTVTPDQTTAKRSGGLFRRLRPGQDLDAELDAYEREQTAAPPAAATVAAAAHVAETEPDVVAQPDAAVEAVVVAEPEPVAEPPAVAGAEVEFAAEPDAVADAEPVLVAEPEVVAEADVATEPEVAVVAAAPILAEPAVAAEPMFIAEPEVVGAAEVAEVAAAAAATPPEPAPPVVDDVIKQPTWRMVAPDPTPSAPTEPAQLPAAATAAPTSEPQWPTRPEMVGSTPAAGLPFLGRPATPTGGLEALWAASTRDLVSGPTPDRPATGIQPCVSCGLSLSATARFCRRCGASQVG